MTHEERKQRPVFTGLLRYFPNACLEVSHVSFIANEQHNPGQPMHWAKEKSIGTGDEIVRHLMDPETFDTDGLRHRAKAAWRALELLEREIEMQKSNKKTMSEVIAEYQEVDLTKIHGAEYMKGYKKALSQMQIEVDERKGTLIK